MSSETKHAEVEEYLLLVDTMRLKKPEWRVGQTYFNVLHDLRPDLANQVRATDMDPFHTETAMPKFMSFIREHW